MSAQLARVVDIQEFRRKRQERETPMASSAVASQTRPMAVWMTTCWVWVMVPAWPAT
jgi:hypothetical protein